MAIDEVLKTKLLLIGFNIVDDNDNHNSVVYTPDNKVVGIYSNLMNKWIINIDTEIENIERLGLHRDKAYVYTVKYKNGSIECVNDLGDKIISKEMKAKDIVKTYYATGYKIFRVEFEDGTFKLYDSLGREPFSADLIDFIPESEPNQHGTYLDFHILEDKDGINTFFISDHDFYCAFSPKLGFPLIRGSGNTINTYKMGKNYLITIEIMSKIDCYITINPVDKTVLCFIAGAYYDSGLISFNDIED
ncbi:MAG: hypothetical protein IJ593_04970 [Lachnospiraceae bacterium]|nr:hypothetical protein [Lachnospiraceae bacterium]